MGKGNRVAVEKSSKTQFNPHKVEIEVPDDFDHVDEDPIIADQRFGVISFYEPKQDVLTLRELLIMEEFIKECLREDPEVGKKRVNLSKVVNLKTVSSSKFLQLYHDFRYDNIDELTKKAKEIYPDQIFERAFKIRGNYKSLKKADEQKNKLKLVDQLHSQYIVEVGKWAPFNPPENAIENYETSNKKLNEMMQEQRKNISETREFYEQQKQERIKKSIQANEERRAKIANNDEDAILAELREQEILGIYSGESRTRPKPSKANRIVADATPEDAGFSSNNVDTSNNYRGIKIKKSEMEHQSLSDYAGDVETQQAYANATMSGSVKQINAAKTAVKSNKLLVEDFDEAEFDNMLMEQITQDIVRKR